MLTEDFVESEIKKFEKKERQLPLILFIVAMVITILPIIELGFGHDKINLTMVLATIISIVFIWSMTILATIWEEIRVVRATIRIYHMKMMQDLKP